METKKLVSDEDVLAYTRGKRQDLVEYLTQNGAPKCKEDQVVLLASLDGLDRSALSRMKIQAEQENAAMGASAAAMVAAVLSQVGTRNIYQVEGGVDREAPKLPAEIPDPVVVEGELDTGTQNLDYDSFIKKMTPPEEES